MLCHCILFHKDKEIPYYGLFAREVIELFAYTVPVAENVAGFQYEVVECVVKHILFESMFNPHIVENSVCTQFYCSKLLVSYLHMRRFPGINKMGYRDWLFVQQSVQDE